MKPLIPLVRIAALTAVLSVVGCGIVEEPPRKVAAPPAKKVSVSSNVTLEVQGDQRRVLIDASVSSREGFLELVLSPKGPNSKGYESLLWAEVDARDINEALLRAKAKPGSPVRFQPEFREAQGQTIKITLRYELDGKQHTVPLQSWIRTRDGKPVELEWVFAGSQLVEDPFDARRKQLTAQLEGTLIGLGVSDVALLDVNIRTAQSRNELDFDYWTERIPPKDTKVTMILEPVGEYKPGKK